jgi:large subunit ribosomal protein L16
MIFTPKTSKFKKYQKGLFPRKLKNNWCWLNETNVNMCFIRLISISHGFLNLKQLTSFRFLIKKFLKKKGFLYFYVFPQKAMTKKPSEIRMGKGKGSFSYWCASIKVGIVICKIFCKLKYKRRLFKMLSRAQIRLPIKTKILG